MMEFKGTNILKAPSIAPSMLRYSVDCAGAGLDLFMKPKGN